MLLLKEMREADVGAPTPYLLTNSYFFVIEYLSVDKKKTSACIELRLCLKCAVISAKLEAVVYVPLLPEFVCWTSLA